MSDSSMSSSLPPISGKKVESTESKGETPKEIMRDLSSKFLNAEKAGETDKLNGYETALLQHLQKNNLHKEFLEHSKGTSPLRYPKYNALRSKAAAISKANVEALHQFAQLHDAPKTETTIKATPSSSASSKSAVKEKSDELEIADLEKTYLIDSIKTPEQSKRFQEVLKHKEEFLGQARYQSSGLDATVFWKDKDNRFYITDKDRTIELFPADVVHMKKDIENIEHKYVTFEGKSSNTKFVFFKKPIHKTDYKNKFSL